MEEIVLSLPLQTTRMNFQNIDLKDFEEEEEETKTVFPKLHFLKGF